MLVDDRVLPEMRWFADVCECMGKDKNSMGMRSLREKATRLPVRNIVQCTPAMLRMRLWTVT